MPKKAVKKKEDSIISTVPTEEGGNAKGVALLLELKSWDKVDLSEPKQVEERINRYFRLMVEYDSRPLVAGLAQALGMDRRRLIEIVNRIDGNPHTARHNITEASRELIIEAYETMETSWEYNFVNGKVNPVTGIFVGRNNYGYKDKVETLIIAKNPLGEIKDREELEKRYLASVITDND